MTGFTVSFSNVTSDCGNSLLTKIFLLHVIFLFVCLFGDGDWKSHFFLQQWESLRVNSGHQVWLQMPLPTEPSCWSVYPSFNEVKFLRVKCIHFQCRLCWDLENSCNDSIFLSSPNVPIPISIIIHRQPRLCLYSLAFYRNWIFMRSGNT